MEKTLNLKAKNTSQLWTFLVAHMLFFLSLNFQAIFSSTEFTFIQLANLLGTPILLLALFILNGLLSPYQKAILVFWKISNPLPGCEAFTRYANRDPRVDLKTLREKFGRLPKNQLEQNKLWYKLFKKNELDPGVRESHRAFLLARDLSSLSFMFIFSLGIPSLLLNPFPVNVIYTAGLIFQYLIISYSARNRGVGFVTNVLAKESAS